MKKILILFVVLALFTVSGPVRAIMPSQGSEYIFHLYMSSANQLVADRDAVLPYEIISDVFSQPLVGQFPYRGEVVAYDGTVAARFSFDVHAGKVSAYAPYVSDGQKVIFYDTQNQALLTIPVGGTSVCNDDGICDTNGGEDSFNCNKDCKQTLPAAPVASLAPVANSADSSGSLVSGILYTLAGLVMIGGVWWFVKRKKAAGALDSSTPTPPSAPTNPV
jgi:LPXTG-motif cell wall-anchored protein